LDQTYPICFKSVHMARVTSLLQFFTRIISPGTEILFHPPGQHQSVCHPNS
jgi:hypothetical protein